MNPSEPSRATFVQGAIVAAAATIGTSQAASAADALNAPAAPPAAPTPGAPTTAAAPARDLETPVEYLNTYITPNDLHFVRSHYGPPASLNVNDWRLSIKGEAANPLSLSIFDLRTQFEQVSVTVVCQCAGNGRGLFSPRASGAQWTYGGVGNARWTGVRLADILARAKIDPNTKMIITQGADRPANPNSPIYTRALPIAKVLDKYTILAYDMNGEPLAFLHGAPARLVIPGWYGNHWMKWLTSLEARTTGTLEDAGFWVAVGYRIPNNPATPGVPVPPDQTHIVEQMDVKSIILGPTDKQVVQAGAPLFVQGIAWSGVPTIRKVEVSVDGGPWREAQFNSEATPYAWRRFSYAFTPSPGTHIIASRATDETGATQPMVATWNPSGYMYNGIMRISVEARSV